MIAGKSSAESGKNSRQLEFILSDFRFPNFDLRNEVRKHVGALCMSANVGCIHVRDVRNVENVVNNLEDFICDVEKAVRKMGVSRCDRQS